MWGAFATLYALTFGNTFYMMWQDKSIFKLSEWKTIYEALISEHQLLPKTMVKFFEYFSRDFHPWQKDNYHLAATIFNRLSEAIGGQNA